MTPSMKTPWAQSEFLCKDAILLQCACLAFVTCCCCSLSHSRLALVYVGLYVYTGCAALCGLVMWSFLQLVLGSYLGPASRTVFALLGALVFSAYIVLDTENLIAK